MHLNYCCDLFRSGSFDSIMLEWKNWLHEEFEELSRFMLPTNDTTLRYPGTDASYGREVMVTQDEDGRFIGYIENRNYRVEFEISDVLIYRFDLRRFRKETGESLGLTTHRGEIGQWDHTIPWGTWEPEKGASYPVTAFLGVDYLHSFRERVMERAIQRQADGEIIITPNRRDWHGNIAEIARKNKLLLVPLNEIVQIENGKFLPTPEWNEYLTAFCKIVERDLPSSIRKEPEGNLFAKRGEWILRFAGEPVTLNGELQGPAFVQRLMMTPHQKVHVEQLWKEVFGDGQGKIAQADGGSEGDWNAFLSSGDEILDAAGKTDYRKRLLQLSRDRAEAESENDNARLERIDAETEAISARLHKAVDGKGHSRKIGDEKDKLRKRISRNITFFLEKLRQNHPELATHIEQNVVMGEHMVYRPSEPVEWSFK